jgi:hypothetical protein
MNNTGSHISRHSQKDRKINAFELLLFLKSEILSSKNSNFLSFYQFPHIYKDRNVDKMTSWETCFKTYI